MDYLTDPKFQGANKLFASFFEDNVVRTEHTGHFLSNLEIENYNVVIDGPNVFDQPVKSDTRTHDNIWKIATSQTDDYTTD